MSAKAKRGKNRSGALFLTALLATPPAVAEGSAAFVCRSSAFGTLRVFLEEHRREAWWERAGSPVRRWELSPAKASVAFPFGEAGWLRYLGTTEPVELATRARVVGGKSPRSVVELVFAVDDGTLRFEECWKQTAGVAVEPRDGEVWLSMVRLDRAALAIDRTGTLGPDAVAAFVQSVRREAGANVVRSDRCERLAPWLPMLSSASAARVAEALSGPPKVFWQGCLERGKHRYFPETKRFAAWAAAGLRELVEVGVGESAVALVVAGTRSFLASRGAAAPEPRRLFLAETDTWTRRLSPVAGERLLEALTREETEWLLGAWLETPAAESYRHLEAVDVAAAEFNEGLARAIGGGEAVDFTEAQRVLTEFLRRSDSRVALRRRRFAQQTGPILLRLSLEERQRLAQWLAPNEIELVEEAERLAQRP